MHWLVESRVRGGFGLALLLMSIIGRTAYWSTVQSVKTANWVVHSQRILGELEQILSLMKDAETGQRGYLLTGRARYLEPYDAVTAVINPGIRQLRRLAKDNPHQQQRLNVLWS